MADGADRYLLYQNSVQDAPADAAFLDDEFHRRRARRALSFREDFCGTAALSCEFVARRPESRAIGVDLDPDPLAWGHEHNIAKLSRAEQGRIDLIESDVLEVTEPRVDLIAAMNFSYWILETRDLMRQYFERVRHALNSDGSSSSTPTAVPIATRKRNTHARKTDSTSSGIRSRSIPSADACGARSTTSFRMAAE